MTTLTPEQKKLYKTLIRLGDSKELALKTVLNQKLQNKDSEIYRIAYYS
tara:strand:- start:109 stop:255 length:147 start_codon:yes stop_codon:yes gene_type:complete